MNKGAKACKVKTRLIICKIKDKCKMCGNGYCTTFCTGR